MYHNNLSFLATMISGKPIQSLGKFTFLDDLKDHVRNLQVSKMGETSDRQCRKFSIAALIFVPDHQEQRPNLPNDCGSRMEYSRARTPIFRSCVHKGCCHVDTDKGRLNNGFVKDKDQLGHNACVLSILSRTTIHQPTPCLPYHRYYISHSLPP